MSYILAIEPDPAQASLLRQALQDVVSEKIIIVGAKDTALAAIDRQVPDLVLLHSLMPPLDDEHLVAYLCTVPDARHVQVIRIPRLLAHPLESDATRLFSRLAKRGVDKSRWSRCDPRVFAGDVTAYLARAHALRHELTNAHADGNAADRRRAFRWTQSDVPWLSSVQLAAGEQADLLDISLSGALVRTPGRPHLASIRGGLEAWTRPGLMLHLSSGDQVQVTGDVVRCRPASSGDGFFYQVAFRFDQSADLYLPTLLLRCAEDPWTRAMAAAKIVGGPTLYLPQALNQWSQW